MTKLPEGILASLTIYIKTEINGEEAEITVKLNGFNTIPEFEANVSVEKIARTLSLDIPLDLAKTRLMTSSEIAEYRRLEEEE